jgi:hypothetical protein
MTPTFMHAWLFAAAPQCAAAVVIQSAAYYSCLVNCLFAMLLMYSVVLSDLLSSITALLLQF